MRVIYILVFIICGLSAQSYAKPCVLEEKTKSWWNYETVTDSAEFKRIDSGAGRVVLVAETSKFQITVILDGVRNTIRTRLPDGKVSSVIFPMSYSSGGIPFDGFRFNYGGDFAVINCSH
jgi:hypothetical protein